MAGEEWLGNAVCATSFQFEIGEQTNWFIFARVAKAVMPASTRACGMSAWRNGFGFVKTEFDAR